MLTPRAEGRRRKLNPSTKAGPEPHSTQKATHTFASWENNEPEPHSTVGATEDTEEEGLKQESPARPVDPVPGNMSTMEDTGSKAQLGRPEPSDPI